MNVTIYPGSLRGKVAAPPSKSHAHRLLTAAALSAGETRILRPGISADILATLRCLKSLGAEVRQTEEDAAVTGPLRGGGAVLDCGESGSTLRFLLPLCAALPGHITLTGRGRLPQRPNAPLLAALRQNGADIEGELPPLKVKGGLRPGRFALPGDVSSQYFTGLLLTLPLLQGDSRLIWTSPLESRPYVDMTLDALRLFGVDVQEQSNGWHIPGGQRYRSPGEIAVEGDWSAAAFWLGANALGSDVKVTGLNEASRQGDRAAEQLLGQIGGEMDLRDTPDLMPVLAAAAAAVPGKTTRIVGAARLRLKESDRIAAMAEAIRALGGEAEETADGLVVHGKELQGGTVDGRRDHRVVMSAAVAATVCRGPVTILGAEAADKSYPDFWRDFPAMGGQIHE